MRYLVIFSVFALAGCDMARGFFGAGEEDAILPAAAPVEATVLDSADAPEAAGEADAAPAVPDAMLPPPVGGGSVLGNTVVSLGDPAIGGMWLKTPLVTSEQPGQVRWRGTVVALTLQPLDAEVGAGSQISVRAMQALGASLTDLVEVTVEAI
ncbi:hypothetical protein [Aestuariivita boseongensis]|uniref:hypothetical protein n=1 Tax=Aestuariivita boseongensis TaxID=1470562 RepID=UPI00068317B6|nr:hypothetical protein [Aestuariivita boseongensis]